MKPRLCRECGQNPCLSPDHDVCSECEGSERAPKRVATSGYVRVWANSVDDEVDLAAEF